MYHLCQNVQEIFVIFLKSQKTTSVLSIFVVKVYETLTPKCPVFMPSDYKRELLAVYQSASDIMQLSVSSAPGIRGLICSKIALNFSDFICKNSLDFPDFRLIF